MKASPKLDISKNFIFYLLNEFYLHNFVVFDKNMNLLGYSEAFNFENKLVEFCLGMEFDNNSKNFIIPYSTLDSTTKLAVFSPDYVNSLIIYI